MLRTCTVLCRVWLLRNYTIFPHNLINRQNFRKEVLEDICMFVFIFTTNMCKIFFILRETGRDIIINVHRSLCKVPILSQYMSTSHSERNKPIECCRKKLAPLLGYKADRHRYFLSSSENPQPWLKHHFNLLGKKNIIQVVHFFLHTHAYL
jgi:hypothetical protein